MVFKIRVILDTKDDIFRDIEIKDKQTLWNMHLGIKSAFSLMGEDLSVFNLLDDEGVVYKTVPLEDMTDDGDGEIMSDVYINEAFENVGDKIHFQYGFLDLWEFFCELIEIQDEKPAVNYPITVFRFGNMPLNAPSKKGNGGSKSAAKAAMPFMDDDFAFGDDFDTGTFVDEEDDFIEEDEEDGYNDDVFDDGDEE